MGNLRHDHPNEGWVGDSAWWVDLNVYLNSQNTGGNYSNITVEIVTYSANSATSQNGVFVGQLWVSGGQWANTTSNHNIGTGGVQIAVASGNVGHDANGNLTVYVEDYANMPSTSMSRRGSNWGLPRIPLAPPITSIIADQIKPTATRLGLEIGGNGHGTSTSMYMQYRLQGDTNWIGTATQGDASGYNYWTISGLKPGKTYEYRGVAYNNNGDQSISGVQTFKTKAIAGLAPLLMALVAG